MVKALPKDILKGILEKVLPFTQFLILFKFASFASNLQMASINLDTPGMRATCRSGGDLQVRREMNS